MKGRSQSRFEWIKGGITNYFNWGPGEPNNMKEGMEMEDCIEVRRGVHWGKDFKCGTWNDRICNHYKHSFVCKSI